jgi:5-methylcytosine-specific restriction protein B
MGELNEVNLRAVQFHPNLSYEDFVRGYRPSGEGKLELVDGPMIEMVNAAKADPARDYVLVIEEINRGNPAQIFGEMLTLLEADKRNPNEALELSHSRGDERVFVPENLYIIGTMNIADRSLAMVDLALRRRFAFINLMPMLNTRWQNWVSENSKVDAGFLTVIRQRLKELNELISNESSLGEQFSIGHSYVTPTKGTVIEDPANWFKQVVKTEIGVLLEEYWYEDLSKARQYSDRLIEGL